MKRLFAITLMVLLLSIGAASAYSVYDYRTPDNYLVYNNQWSRLGCDDNDCYDYYRIARYGHRSSFGYEHFVENHLRYYTAYDHGYNIGYGDGYVDGRYDERYYDWYRRSQRYNHPINYNENPSCYNNYGIRVC
jgi:hypothetical protein